MKFFNWVQNKFNGDEEKNKSTRNNMPNPIPVTNNLKKEPPKAEFNDWPHGLLTIGTFGNKDLKGNQRIQVERIPKTEIIPQEEEQCSSPDFSEFTAEEVVKLQKELKRLLTRKTIASKASAEEQQIVDLPLDRFLNCPSSLEVDRTISNRYSVTSDDHKDEEEIDRTIRIILGRCKDVCEKKKVIGKKSISFLLKKMFVCRSGFVPTPHLRDSLQESRMEKLMRTMLTKKIYPQNGSRASSMKKYIEDNRHKPKAEKEDESRDKNSEGSSRWDKTDSDFIVLEI